MPRMKNLKIGKKETLGKNYLLLRVKGRKVLGENIKKAIGKSRLTNSEICLLCGFSRQLLNYVINGKKYMSDSNLKKLSKALKVDIKELIKGVL